MIGLRTRATQLEAGGQACEARNRKKPN